MARTIEYKLVVEDDGTAKIKRFGSSLSTLDRKGSRAFKKMTEETKKFNSRLTMLSRTLGRLQRTLVAIAGVWAAREIIRGIEKIVDTGIEYNRILERTRIGIGAVIAAQTKVLDQTGRELVGREKINAVQEIAKNISIDLLRRNRETAATYQQLITMFQQALPHALSEGFNIKQVEDFTVAMSQAATSMGIPLNMMAEEMRSMLKGTISTKNTLIATALHMDKAVIKSLQGKADKLFFYIMNRLKAFVESADDIKRSWDGVLTDLKQSFEQTIGVAFKTFFKNLKTSLRELGSYLRSPQFQALANTWASIAENMLEITKAVLTLPTKLPGSAFVREQGGLLPWARPTKENLKKQLAKVYGVPESALEELKNLKGKNISVPGSYTKGLAGMHEITIGKTPEDFLKTKGKYTLVNTIGLGKKLKEKAIDIDEAWKKNREDIKESANAVYDQLETTLKLRLQVAQLTKDKDKEKSIQEKILGLELNRKLVLGNYTDEQKKLLEEVYEAQIQKLYKLKDANSMIAENIKDVWSSTMQDLKNSLADWIETAKFSFDSIVDLFHHAMSQLLASWITTQLQMAAKSQFGGEGLIGAIISGIGGLFGAGGGSYKPTAGKGEWTYSFGSTKAMASGGIINEPVYGVGQRSGRGYLLGEGGPEAVTPLNAAGTNVTVNIENKGTEKEGKAQVMFDPKGMIVNVILEDLHSYGPIYQNLKGGT